MNSTNHKKISGSLSHLLLRRLLFAYVSLALVITGVQMFIEYHATKEEVVNNLQSLAKTFSPGAESALWELQETLLNSMVNGIGANPAVVSVDISDSDGHISASWHASSGLLASPALTVQQALYHKDSDGIKKYLGNLRIASSDALLTSRLKNTLLSIGFTTSAIFLCLGMMLWFLARSLVIRPLVFFSDQVNALSVIGQSKQIDLGRIEVNEIETLKQGFNRLMQQLEESHTQIAGQNVLLQNEKIALKRESEKNLALLRNASDGIHILDVEGNIIEASDSFCAMLGYEHREIVGMNLSQWDPKDPDNLAQALEQRFATQGRSQFETLHRCKDGTFFYVEVSCLPLDLAGEQVLFCSSRDITERKASEDKIQRLAFYDHLTGLPNRLLLIDRLQQAMVSSGRSCSHGALLFIDLDNFKNLNDTLGHDKGDMLLKQVTQRLGSSIREGDTVSRLGGDEFVVMLVGLSEQSIDAAAQSEIIGEKILTALSQPYQLEKNAYRCTASIGVTLFSGSQQATDELMKQADIAMYQAKKAGRNTLRFFDLGTQENISARVSLESELHNAIEFQQFHLHYQIQVDSSNRPLGAEALIRWVHPVRGMVSPAQFIPLAEETGLILSIGKWVLDTACAQIKAWQQDILTRHLKLAVNVSAKQFHQADFVEQVQSAAQRHAINPMLLKLELTESLLQENIDDTIAIMIALKKIGVQFSLDDFGTGYSSLQYLKRLPLAQLKIDQSFVRDIAIDSSDKAIVSTIIAMAQSLNLDVIAEGVETEEQRQFLLDSGCTHYQGYLFSKPIPIEQFEMLLKQNK